MLFHPSSYGKDIGVKNYILFVESYNFSKNIIGAFTNLNTSFKGVGLSIFVKSHNNHCSTIGLDRFCLGNKCSFAFFEGYRIYNTFSLDTFKSGFNNFPFGAVDHYRHSRNIRFSCNQIQKGDHCFFPINHSFIHVHINDLGTTIDLLQCNRNSRLIIS